MTTRYQLIWRDPTADESREGIERRVSGERISPRAPFDAGAAQPTLSCIMLFALRSSASPSRLRGRERWSPSHEFPGVQGSDWSRPARRRRVRRARAALDDRHRAEQSGPLSERRRRGRAVQQREPPPRTVLLLGHPRRASARRPRRPLGNLHRARETRAMRLAPEVLASVAWRRDPSSKKQGEPSSLAPQPRGLERRAILKNGERLEAEVVERPLGLDVPLNVYWAELGPVHGLRFNRGANGRLMPCVDNVVEMAVARDSEGRVLGRRVPAWNGNPTGDPDGQQPPRTTEDECA